MTRPAINAAIPEFSLPTTSGATISIGGNKDRWTLLLIYRGKHCPRCKKYLNKLNAMLADWQALLDVIVVSADPEEKAKADQAEFGWDFELGYDLSVGQMRALGTYVSTPLSDAESDRPFSEPGTFAIRPDGTLILVDISNGPAARPDLEELYDGMRFNIENDRPARGLG